MIFGKGGYYAFDISLDVLHMLDSNSQPCNQDPTYDYDQCLSAEADMKNMNKYGCTSGLDLDQESICQNGTILTEMKANYVSKYLKNTTCTHPCSYLIVKHERSGAEPFENDTKIIQFNLPEKVTVITSQYFYDGLSMIAEIGGYVGLFLGVSVLQITDLLKVFMEKMRKWQRNMN